MYRGNKILSKDLILIQEDKQKNTHGAESLNQEHAYYEIFLSNWNPSRVDITVHDSARKEHSCILFLHYPIKYFN